MKKKTLNELVDKLEKIENEVLEYFEENIQDRLNACKTAEECRVILREISLQCTRKKDGGMRDIPGLIHVRMCMAISRFIPQQVIVPYKVFQ